MPGICLVNKVLSLKELFTLSISRRRFSHYNAHNIIQCYIFFKLHLLSIIYVICHSCACAKLITATFLENVDYFIGHICHVYPWCVAVRHVLVWKFVVPRIRRSNELLLLAPCQHILACLATSSRYVLAFLLLTCPAKATAMERARNITWLHGYRVTYTWNNNE